jgi:hypothetical protein
VWCVVIKAGSGSVLVSSGQLSTRRNAENFTLDL